ncbi:MAG TPA: tRNA lysidine(34) synthetase TilS, partial [Bacillota bacterium]|nr:tRNA lysidine(34) synthetase TilS [Bacillota bacterium]
MGQSLMEKVAVMNQKYKMFQEGDHVLVAVSCGIDSITLLHVLGDSRFGIHRTVAYVHHGLRAEADQEAEWITRLAETQGIDCHILRIDVRGRANESGESIQMAARAERYQALQDLARKVGAKRIALGHHANDQAETFLIRMLTGTGLEGLAGMAPIHSEIYIRPMLSVTRSEIRAYAKDKGLSWLEDRSNQDTHYLRNRIRLEILPLLESIQPQLVTHLSGLSALAEEWRDWLGAELENSLSKLDYTLQDSGVVWSLPVWRRLPEPLKRAVIKRAFYELFPDRRLELAHMERILCAAAEDNTARIQLPGAGYLIIRGQRMEIRTKKTPKETVRFLIPLIIPGETFCLGGKLVARWIGREELPENWRQIPGEEAYFDVESLNPKLFLRNRRNGDRIRLFGRSGTERLKKLLIDWKIPQESRDLVPLLVDEDDRIW